MSHTDQNVKNNSAMMNKKIKETWSGLSDEDVNLYDTKPDQFFAKLTEKQNVKKEDAQTKLREIEKGFGNKDTKVA